MTAKQILDGFSQTLMQDPRVLSPQERELLVSLLRNARNESSGRPEIQKGVAAVIAQSVGETVAQRAFSLLGSSIVEQILSRAEGAGATQELGTGSSVAFSPQPPAPQPPGSTTPGRPIAPQPPAPTQPSAPQPPSGPHGVSRIPVQEGRQSPLNPSRGIEVLEEPAVGRAQYVVLDEFLAPQEVNELVTYVMEHEVEFKNSEVISPSGEPGATDYDHRRSQVLMDLGKYETIFLDRIRGMLPRVLERLGIEEFPLTQGEVQITASNDGDFFRAHSDDSQEAIASRCVTFVYFFHREPRKFEGGELRLHNAYGRDEAGRGTYHSIVPQQNQIVFFPCGVLHEITQIECPSRGFAHSRFTVNGWLHK